MEFIPKNLEECDNEEISSSAMSRIANAMKKMERNTFIEIPKQYLKSARICVAYGNLFLTGTFGTRTTKKHGTRLIRFE